MPHLSQSKIKKLMAIGKTYSCPFHLPPFLKRHNPFFDMSKIENCPVKTLKFISAVAKVGCHYGIHIVNKRKLMEIMSK